MCWLNIKTEFSFGSTYGPIDLVAKKVSEGKIKAAGIADINGSWGHIKWKKACEQYGIKPIFGARLSVMDDPSTKERRLPFDMMSFIAMDNSGLKELYRLIETAHDQFYYKPLISYDQLNNISSSIQIIAAYSPRLDLVTRNIFFELSPATPLRIRNLKGVKYIACCDNWFIEKEDDIVYEPFADERLRERKTSPMHILTDKEWKQIYPDRKEALNARNKLLKAASATLTKAHLVRYQGKDKIEEWCQAGAKKKGIDLTKKEYKDRLKREMDLIKEKDFTDYFLVVADLIRYAKSKMFVGHSRGSSAGSLVCYLMGITEIDPLKFGLVFERFIDINRADLPDIDVDFQDDKRHLVVKYLQDKYGKENVAQIGNINQLKPKSALARFAKALNIPAWEVDEVKDAIVERSGGDARAALCILDTFNESDIGKQFIQAYPNMMPVSKIENHASHTGVHAAGVIVCNEPVTEYCGVNTRDNSRVAMIDKKDAEIVNLLKIDALGLRTLTIIAETCDRVGIKYEDLYTIPLDDKKTFKVFKKQRLTGIFQFEGDAVRNLAKQMPVETIDDISALSALGRPGPLATGGATAFVNRRSGREKVEYMSEHPVVIEQIKDTFGVIIYQEQVMNIGKYFGDLSWEDVSELRKAMSRSLGDEFFGKYKEKFVQGAIKKGSTEKDAEVVWKNMNTMGSWSFNKSHAVSYAMITYLCAYLKAHEPLEFAVATLNHAKDDKSAIKLLRDLKENENIEYIPVSIAASKENWSIYKGKLLEGFISVDGIGPVGAKRIVADRDNIPPGIMSKLRICKTPFKYIYPGRQLYGDYYIFPERFGVRDSNIITMDKLSEYGDGYYVVIGMLTKKVVRDANEAILVSKRGYPVDGPTAYINMAFEDDTESILAAIGREKYEQLGKEIAESGKVDKDWYLLSGWYDSEWNKIKIDNIRRITKDE